MICRVIVADAEDAERISRIHVRKEPNFGGAKEEIIKKTVYRVTTMTTLILHDSAMQEWHSDKFQKHKSTLYSLYQQIQKMSSYVKRWSLVHVLPSFDG